MAEPDPMEAKHRLYDVDRFKKLLAHQRLQPRPRRILRLLRRSRQSVESVGGISTALSGIPLMFGGIFAVIIGLLYGPIVFLAVVGSVFGLVTFYVDRKVGKSLQFGDYPLHKKILGQVAGFALVLGLLLLMFAFTDLIAWINRFL